MLEKIHYKLELEKILDELSERCTFSVSRDIIRDFEFTKDLDLINIWQNETSEAKEILRFYPTIPISGLRDIRSTIKRAEIGALLNPSEILTLVATLKAGKRLKNFILDIKKNYELVKEIANEIGDFTGIERIVEATIDDEASIRDNASSELYKIRRKINSNQEKIKTKLDEILRTKTKYLQENIITIRNNRYVVPIKQEYRNQFPGLVHDQSSSGATLFIEPMTIVDLNNQLRNLESEEKNEIEKILRQISDLIAKQVDLIRYTLEKLGYLDFVFAKAKLSNNMDGSQPFLNNEGKVRIIKGRHPLITGTVVPITLELGYDFRTLVITGPNTGGKTVTLKTVGLLSLMAQMGLHIPSEPGSEIAIYNNIFVDIGDEQSIEQSLSTFSAHLINIIRIVKGIDKNSLVLLDELGAGTDPAEGSALAMSILEFLHQAGVKTIATTHYSELKTFAYSYPGVKNASVEFNTETLQPTYRLLIGLPGRSNALDIAYRLGLPKYLVDKAKGYINKEDLQVADIIQDLEENRKTTEIEKKEAEDLRKELTILKKKLKDKEIEIQIKEKEIMEKALKEADQYIRIARMEADELLRNLKTTLTEEAKKAQEQAVQQAKQKFRKIENEIDNKIDQNEELVQYDEPKNLKKGDSVFLNNLQQRGTVLEITNDEILVQVGIMKINVNLKDISLIKEDKNEKVRSIANNFMKQKSSNISNELDLRGMLVEEALFEVDKYLDNALLANLQLVYIIHGKGTGALRKGIKSFLLKHPHVKEFRLGNYGEGGSGVTVVSLK